MTGHKLQVIAKYLMKTPSKTRTKQFRCNNEYRVLLHCIRGFRQSEAQTLGLFDLIESQSTIFQVCRNGFPWVEPVPSKKIGISLVAIQDMILSNKRTTNAGRKSRRQGFSHRGPIYHPF